jgi:hypothetical protein
MWSCLLAKPPRPFAPAGYTSIVRELTIGWLPVRFEHCGLTQLKELQMMLTFACVHSGDLHLR